MKQSNKLYIAVLAALTFFSCNPVKIIEQHSLPEEYVSGWEERYGVCYDSIPHAVVALDLYTDGLTLDTAKHKMLGTGYNLYFSDIFVPGDSLVAGTYHADTSAQPFTFLPGREYEGTPTGMYLLYVENGKLQTIQVLDSCTFTIRDTTNGWKDIRFTLYYTDAGAQSTYECHFQDSLPCLNK